MHRSLAAGVAILMLIGLPAAGAEGPKRGGTLTYMIPADAPPSTFCLPCIGIVLPGVIFSTLRGQGELHNGRRQNARHPEDRRRRSPAQARGRRALFDLMHLTELLLWVVSGPSPRCE
jgi:hypothetical protein